MAKWRIYYGDRSIFSSEDGPPHEAPLSGVQVVVEIRDGRTLQYSLYDYYGWDGEKWEGDNERHTKWQVILEGTFMDTTEFKVLRGEAITWLDQH